MGMYASFRVDEKRKEEGVWLDYGDFRIRVGHAGQSNKRYMTYMEKALRPVRQAMNAGTLSNDRSLAIMADIFAKTVILAWEVSQTVDGKTSWVEGIEGPEGEILPYDEDNVIATFKALPELFVDIQNQSSSIANFRRLEVETDQGN